MARLIASLVLDNLSRANFGAINIAIGIDSDALGGRGAGVVRVLVRIGNMHGHPAIESAADIDATRVAAIDTFKLIQKNQD